FLVFDADRVGVVWLAVPRPGTAPRCRVARARERRDRTGVELTLVVVRAKLELSLPEAARLGDGVEAKARPAGPDARPSTARHLRCRRFDRHNGILRRTAALVVGVSRESDADGVDVGCEGDE